MTLQSSSIKRENLFTYQDGQNESMPFFFLVDAKRIEPLESMALSHVTVVPLLCFDEVELSTSSLCCLRPSSRGLKSKTLLPSRFCLLFFIASLVPSSPTTLHTSTCPLVLSLESNCVAKHSKYCSEYSSRRKCTTWVVFHDPSRQTGRNLAMRLS
jgi:hypothetical protein